MNWGIPECFFRVPCIIINAKTTFFSQSQPRQLSNMAEFLEYDWNATRLAKELITEDMRYKRKNEPVDIPTKIDDLRTYIKLKGNAELKNNINQDDSTLRKHLFARKFSIESTYELILNSYLYRRKNSELFVNFTSAANDIRHNLENCLPGVLDCRDRKGRTVIILTAINWDCTYNILSVYRALLYTLEVLTEDLHNQANGFVVIVDWTEFTFRQSTYLKPSILKLIIEGLQDAFPAKFKGIHFVGQPWYVETAITFIKPFLKDKTKERIFVHGNNLSTLHEYVHIDVLPAEMGGEQASYNPAKWLKRAEEFDNCVKAKRMATVVNGNHSDT